MEGLYNRLSSYRNEDFYPMHMPGHKRNAQLFDMVNPYEIDITEIEGFDNLHQQEGILKQLSERIRILYGTGRSYPLINGSTAGILAGIAALTNRGDTVLLARNAHKSVYHAILLMGLKPVYIYPPRTPSFQINGGISASSVEEALIRHKDIRLVIITSPTYEGVVSDIFAIADTVHRHGALLFVDEAHGAHFGFHPGFPVSATKLGADLVVQSLHKTLPAFTQTAVLHCNRREAYHRLENYLSIYQSSSPSYILLAGIDRCISLMENRKVELFDSYYSLLSDFYRSMEALNQIKLLDKSVVGQNGVFDLDLSKITLSLRDTSVNGHQFHQLLRDRYHIVLELEAFDYVLGMTSICDTKEGFDRLRDSLLALDEQLGRSDQESSCGSEPGIRPVQAMLPQEAFEQETEQIMLVDSVGRVGADFLSIYPPGIPLLVPGERIDLALVEYLCRIIPEGITVTGLAGANKDRITVVKDS